MENVFHAWRPTFLVDDSHAYALIFFLPTERLWSFECASTNKPILYSQTTYTQHMARKYEFEQDMDMFYEAMSDLFILTPKAIEDLPKRYQKRAAKMQDELDDIPDPDAMMDDLIKRGAIPGKVDPRIKAKEEEEFNKLIKDVYQGHIKDINDLLPQLDRMQLLEVKQRIHGYIKDNQPTINEVQDSLEEEE